MSLFAFTFLSPFYSYLLIDDTKCYERSSSCLLLCPTLCGVVFDLASSMLVEIEASLFEPSVVKALLNDFTVVKVTSKSSNTRN